jgi:hypothetical protein
MHHKTTAYVFVGILRVMLNSLNQQLLRNERQTYALEDIFCSVNKFIDQVLKKVPIIP